MSTRVKKYTIRDQQLIMSDGAEREYILDGINDLPDFEKPRERLAADGPNALSSEELLAIVLNVGTKKEGVLQMSHRIIKEYGGESIGYHQNPKIIAETYDIPLSKACQVVACFELGRRFYDRSHGTKQTIRNAKQVYTYCKDMRDLEKEQLRGIYLNSRYKIVHDEVISIGDLTTSIAHPREIFRPALEHSATAVILVHNHPSGSAKPSPNDITTTEELVEAGKKLKIPLIDHVIVTKNNYQSIPADYDV